MDIRYTDGISARERLFKNKLHYWIYCCYRYITKGNNKLNARVKEKTNIKLANAEFIIIGI